MSTDNPEQLPVTQDASTGFVTQARDRGMAPAMMAEQQRAKSEIEASLTIAAARPRDHKVAIDRIRTACQRPGLAKKAKYRYSKGGTQIEGVTIGLMQVVAQMWGNLSFGFRELSRHPGTGGGAGESSVEAFAWDLETNVRRFVQFTVPHCEQTKKGMRIITDPRGIYEWVANNAQRRVRTCLENIIPEDVYEDAGDECEKTMRTNVGDIGEAITKMLLKFATFGVTREMLEARLQRRLETIAPAQVVYLRGIYRGFEEGVSQPGDWFDMTLSQKEEEEKKPQTPVEAAKEKMRSQQVAQPPATAPAPIQEPVQEPLSTEVAPTQPPVPSPVQAAPAPAPVPAPQAAVPATEPPLVQGPVQGEPEPSGENTGWADIAIEEYRNQAEAHETLAGLRLLREHAQSNGSLAAAPDVLSLVLESITAAEERLKASRGITKAKRGG